MAIKKSELYSSLWQSCDELRGSMDASQYKDYVLILLFVKYMSDKYARQKSPIFAVPEGGSFSDLVALKGQKDIGDRMNKIISKLAEANKLSGILDITDFNDVTKLGRDREMQDRLSNLITIFENPLLDFAQNHTENDVTVGGAFEYLTGMFATNPGRMGGGEFFTPSEVSELIAKLIEPKPGEQIYDPVCGSGLLLVKCAEQANFNSHVYGQELNQSMQALATMNLLLHNIKSTHIECGNTLRNPLFIDGNQLMKFDVVAADPPLSIKNWGYEDWLNDKFDRNVGGVPPRNNGDFAWILHVVASMKNDTGRAAIIVPHGVLFRGGAEQTLRQYITENDLLEAVISLGPNLLYATGIPICILIFRAKKASNKKGKVLFVNASTLFEKKGTKNNIPKRSIEQILAWCKNFTDVPGSVQVIPIKKLREMVWNLNVSHYIKPEPGKLLENAIVSIRLGLDDFEMGTEERIVSSIRNLYAGMLLLFKEKLLRLSPSESNEVLIKSRVIPIKENGKIKFKGADRNTVDVAQIRDRFKDLDIKVNWDRVKVIQNKRNDIEHYYTTEKKDAIREVISSTFIVIHDFIEKELNDNPRELLGDKYWNTMLKTSELFESKRTSCLNSLKEIKWQPITLAVRVDEICCSSCNSSLIAPSEPITPKVENQYFTCMSCGQSISYNDLLEALLRDQPFEEINAKEMGS